MNRQIDTFIKIILVLCLVLICIFLAIKPKKVTAQTDTTEVEVVADLELKTYFNVPISQELQDHIFVECKKHNILPAVIVALIEKESVFDNYAIGDDGRAFGLMQVQPKWHLERMIELNCTDLFDPFKNITVGVNYLSELLNRYDGNIEKALTAYNRGSFNGKITNYAKEILKRADNFEVINNG